MSRWRTSGFPPYSPKRPPPAHGIKLKEIGTTWWGQRWIEALERVLAGDAGRLTRGRTYARTGRTHDFHVTSGKVTANVTGSRPDPYEVTIALQQLSDDVWERAISAMASKAQFAAELLAGQMPRQIDEVFVAAGGSLFPATRADLKTTCNCPDWGDPCKHVAAAHYVLGEALDRDPFLLFELRGRDKPRVLAELRRQRGDVESSEAPAGIKLGPLSAADYDRAPAALPSLSLSFEPPAKPGALLEQLGKPASWRSADSPAAALSPAVQRAAETARRIALAESTTAEPEPAGRAPAVPTPPAPKRKRRR